MRIYVNSSLDTSVCCVDVNVNDESMGSRIRGSTSRHSKEKMEQHTELVIRKAKKKKKPQIDNHRETRLLIPLLDYFR